LAARLLGLSTEQTVHALGSAEYFGPIAQMIPEVERPTYRRDSSGWGALVGVDCALMAQAGYIGGPPLLVEKAPHGLWEDLGKRWRIHEQYFKPYPVCRWAQGSIEAAFQVRRIEGFEAQHIIAIENQTFETATHLSHGVPTTTEGAQYGLSWPIACALVKGHVEPEDVMPKALEDPAICRLAEKVKSTTIAEFTQKFPQERWARLVITLSDGRIITSDAHKPTGDPDCPISAQGMEDKYTRYTVPVTGKTRSAALRQEIARLTEPDRPLDDLLGLVFSPIGLGATLIE
jgi:2-methylcitrate dehydratase PrpD